ncbi:probable mitochondrial import inner membrane translocase subunit TIM21 isoform X2 [Salvia splendens]|uniref:probable mitochondrial import inner membrane translocase subunit TIM21 isoform X2 n=1 Tax=Salvia splendens TaxID=180675 RepID=UPI001C26D477|nr:probable mitochondrial import inner membrane translocase subunit TIM21 isoform X2 [Salvia splendens]
MSRGGFGMKNKLFSVLRSSCNGLKPRNLNALADVASAQYSSSATQRSLVTLPINGNSILCRNEWARKHVLVHRSPFQLSGSAGQQISRSCYARSFASQPTASNKSKGSQTRKELSNVEDPFDSPTYNIPEKPVTFTEGASYSLVILAGLGIAGAAAYAVCKELIFEPKEYKIFNKALERVQSDSQVVFSISMVCYSSWHGNRNNDCYFIRRNHHICKEFKGSLNSLILKFILTLG